MLTDVFDRVVHCIATTTRYPKELLTATADLENDLGIDSVKNLEIVLALADEFELDLARLARDPSIRTVQDVASWIAGLMESQVQSEQQPETIQRADLCEPACNSSCNDSGPNGAVHKSPHFLSAREAPPLASSRPSPHQRTLDGQIAFITGSGRGVGRTIARVLAARGASVIVNSFHSRDLGEQTTAEIVAQGGSAFHLWGSVANPEHVDRMFREIDERFGRLDILVCNASDGRIGSFLELTSDDWERAFRTNVSGHHQCAVRAAELMKAGGGSIVTMSAVGANRYIEGLGSQGVVKAAVESMTRYLACELGQYGIRVNCVAGGPVYGELLSKFPSASQAQEHWESMTPDGELCSPLDLANAVAFLLSNEARGINGSVWMVDHGFSAIADGRPLRSAFQPGARTAATI